MKKLFTLLLLIISIFCVSPTQKVYAEDNQKVRITSIICDVYDNCENFEEQYIITTLNYNDTVEVINEISNNNIKFYEIKIDNKIGYINFYDAVYDNIKPITKRNKTNCTIISNSKEKFVTVYQNFEDNFVETNKKIKVNSKVIVNDNFSYNKKYNLVYFYDEQDNFIQGYINTKNLRKDGINLGLIIGISLIVISIVVFIILLIIIIKKRKENGNKMHKKYSS